MGCGLYLGDGVGLVVSLGSSGTGTGIELGVMSMRR